MKNWLKGAIVGAGLYILMNLALLFSGNPTYRQTVQLDIIKNITPFLLWAAAGAVVFFIIGWIINKIKSGSNKR